MEQKKERKKPDTPLEKVTKLSERESAIKNEISKLQKELKGIPEKRRLLENQIAGEIMRNNNLSIDDLHKYINQIKGIGEPTVTYGEDSEDTPTEESTQINDFSKLNEQEELEDEDL